MAAATSRALSTVPALFERGAQEQLRPEALARLRFPRRVIAEMIADHLIDRG